jgi:hypothetical protein
VHVVDRGAGTLLLVYFYLFSHTEPYKCCACLCPLKRWAHRADLKFVAVELKDGALTRVYFGAHGPTAGEWVNVDKVALSDGTHPIARCSHGDHSTYKKVGCFPRICGTVYDVTSDDIICKPAPIRVYGEKESGFKPRTMGWLYFPPSMNSSKEIVCPSRQWWFEGNLPEESNSWWKRLCCPKYW